MSKTMKIAVLFLATLSLSACGSLNKGTAMSEELQELMADTPGVVSVESNSNNSLPFVGDVSSVVTLEEDLSNTEINEVIEVLTEFYPGSFSAGIIVPLEYSKAELEVKFNDEDFNAEMLETAKALDSTELDSFSLSSERVRLVANGNILSALDMSYLKIDYFNPAAVWSVSSKDSLFNYETLDPSKPSATRQAYERAHSLYLIQEASVTDDTIILSIDSFDHQGLEARIKEEAPQALIAINYPGVTKAVPGSYEITDLAVEPILGDPEVESITLKPFEIKVQTTTLKKLFTLNSDISTSSLDSRVRTFYLYNGTKFKIENIKTDIKEYQEVFIAANEQLKPESLMNFWLRSTGLWVKAGDISLDEASTLGGVISDFAPAGTVVTFNIDKSTFSLKVAEDGSYKDLDVIKSAPENEDLIEEVKGSFTK